MKIWTLASIAIAIFMGLNWYMQEQQDHADELYRKSVIAKRLAIHNKAICELANQSEYITGFAMEHK